MIDYLINKKVIRNSGRIKYYSNYVKTRAWKILPFKHDKIFIDGNYRYMSLDILRGHLSLRVIDKIRTEINKVQLKEDYE